MCSHSGGVKTPTCDVKSNLWGARHEYKDKRLDTTVIEKEKADNTFGQYSLIVIVLEKRGGGAKGASATSPANASMGSP